MSKLTLTFRDRVLISPSSFAAKAIISEKAEMREGEYYAVRGGEDEEVGLQCRRRTVDMVPLSFWLSLSLSC